MKTPAYLLLALLAGFGLLPCKQTEAVPYHVNYLDGAGEGFNDPTLGAARKAAFEYAAAIWCNQLQGTVTIEIDAYFDPMGGTALSATLGMAGSLWVAIDDPSFPQANTFYPAPLVNQFLGSDGNPGSSEIRARFNSDVDNSTVLGTVDFYYGTDGNPGADVDFVTTVLHEMGHGLGYFSGIKTSPAPDGTWLNGSPMIFDRQLRQGTSPSGNFDTLSDSARLAAITSGDLWWKGANVVAAKGGQVKMYAPNPYEAGSSVSHWDTSNSPNLLMEPFDTGVHHSIDLTREAFLDIGWTFTGPTPTPTTPPMAGGRYWELY